MGDSQNRSCGWLLMHCSLDAPSTYFPNRKEQEEREEGRSQDVTKTIKTHWDQLGLLLCLFSNLCPEVESSYFHWFCFLQRCLLYQSLRKIRLYKSLPFRTRQKRPELITSSCYNGRDIQGYFVWIMLTRTKAFLFIIHFIPEMYILSLSLDNIIMVALFLFFPWRLKSSTERISTHGWKSALSLSY